jgi:hypothetical protein
MEIGFAFTRGQMTRRAVDYRGEATRAVGCRERPGMHRDTLGVRETTTVGVDWARLSDLGSRSARQCRKSFRGSGR